MSKRRRTTLRPRLEKYEGARGITYSWRPRVNGKQETHRIDANTDTEAIRIWAAWEGLEYEDNSFRALAEEYLSRELPNKSIATQKSYAVGIKKMIEHFGDMLANDITPGDVYGYLRTRPKISGNREHAMLSSIMRHGIMWNYNEINPMRDVMKHREKPRDRYIEDDELELLVDLALPQMKPIIEFAYLTAMRKGDILKLTWGQISDDGITFKQKKTGRRMMLQWTPALKSLIDIQAKRRKSFFVFPCKPIAKKHGRADFGAYTSTGFDSSWQRLVKRSGLQDVHFHDIRAKAATDAKRDGLDYQSLLGHAIEATSNRYLRGRETAVVQPLNRPRKKKAQK